MTPLCVNVKTAAETIGVSTWVVRRYIASGLLPRVMFPSVKRPGEDSRRVLVAVADLEAFVQQHREVEP
jgi:predicted site-specific integrase-resolvase